MCVCVCVLLLCGSACFGDALTLVSYRNPVPNPSHGQENNLEFVQKIHRDVRFRLTSVELGKELDEEEFNWLFGSKNLRLRVLSLPDPGTFGVPIL